MNTLTITLTDRQLAGLTVEGKLPEGLAPAEFAQMRITSLADAYAEKHRVGRISSGAFVLRFEPMEIVAIRAAAAVSPAVAGYLQRVQESLEVVLDADEVVYGLEGLEAAGLLAPGRAAAILIFQELVPELDPFPEPFPEPEPEPEPEGRPEPERQLELPLEPEPEPEVAPELEPEQP